MVIRNYKNGSPFLLLFPDGTGNVFYPSGNVAVTISLVTSNMHIMSIFSDEEQNLIAFFDPFGNACVNHINTQYNNNHVSKIRMILTPFGGLEFDQEGLRKKRWQWWDIVNEHVHAPPFQPYIFTLNKNLSVKITNQEKIQVNFFAENLMCKFRVGSKIKVRHRLSFSLPNNMPFISIGVYAEPRVFIGKIY
jgi:hypothetical protein